MTIFTVSCKTLISFFPSLLPSFFPFHGLCCFAFAAARNPMRGEEKKERKNFFLLFFLVISLLVVFLGVCVCRSYCFGYNVMAHVGIQNRTQR